MLELLCDAYGEWRALRTVARKGGSYASTKADGDVMHRQRPEVKQAADAYGRYAGQLAKYTALLETKPAPKATTDPMDELLERRSGRRSTGS